jgi:hypothetical protein
MRLISLFVTCLITVLAVRSASGADVILKDGQSIAVAKPYVVKGKMAILTRTDGSLVSIPVDDVDVEKTAAAAAKPASPAPEPTPAPVKKATTPAEAARAKAGKRSTVVLTDAEVRSSVPAGPSGETKEKGDGAVSISGANATRTKSGYTINGSVVNSGKGDVQGITVTIELVGESGTAMLTTQGTLAKDALAPGEKATFTAEVESETEAKSIRYVPSWQVTMPVKVAEPSGGSSGKAAAGASAKPSPTPEASPVPRAQQAQTDSPRPTPQYVPRPDVAPPTASAPVGAPSAPGGVYVPRPADNQPGGTKTP